MSAFQFRTQGRPGSSWTTQAVRVSGSLQLQRVALLGRLPESSFGIFVSRSPSNG